MKIQTSNLSFPDYICCFIVWYYTQAVSYKLISVSMNMKPYEQ